jgi:hypothetical protein
MRRYKTLEEWIKEALSDGDKAECTMIACVYNKPQGGTKEVHSVKILGKTWKPSDLSELFRGKAETFAQDMGGIQTFELQGFYGRNEPEATHTFVVMDGEIRAGGRDRSVRESPDKEGLVAFAMRGMREAHEHLITLVQQISVTSIQKEMAWTSREEKMQTEITDGYTIIREMLMEKIKADHELRMKELEYSRSTDERRKLLAMAPALANTVSGREIFPQNTADTALIEALAEKVKPEFIELLVKSGALPAELAGPLAVRFTETLKKKEAEREAIKKLPPSNSDPKHDATGGEN